VAAGAFFLIEAESAKVLLPAALIDFLTPT
jgi:hypothetical protein